MVRATAAGMTLIVMCSLAHAGFRESRTFIGSLRAGPWAIFDLDGEPVMSHAPAEIEKRGAKRLSAWNISTPTITTADGAWRLALDEGAVPPGVKLAKKPAGADWVFEIVGSRSPTNRGTRKSPEREGYSGYDFRVQVANGKWRGWYVGAEKIDVERPDSSGKPPLFRRFVLVKDQKSALLFEYLEAKYSLSR